MRRDHTHHYHAHPTWPTHVACTLCGWAIPRSLGDAAIMAGAQWHEHTPWRDRRYEALPVPPCPDHEEVAP